MRTVHKFDLPHEAGWATISMPAGAKILWAADQMGAPKIWAEVDTSNSNVDRSFFVAGTGVEIPEDMVHVASYAMHRGMLIWHVYEASDA